MSKMLKDQCISVTELRKQTTQCLQRLRHGEKYIFVNNKPIAVLLDIDMYENFFKKPTLQELPPHQITSKIQNLANETQKLDSSEFVNL